MGIGRQNGRRIDSAWTPPLPPPTPLPSEMTSLVVGESFERRGAVVERRFVHSRDGVAGGRRGA